MGHMAGKTNPYDIESVSGYPRALQIYRIPASSAWQVRLFVGRKYLRKSTRCESKGRRSSSPNGSTTKSSLQSDWISTSTVTASLHVQTI